MGKYNYSVELLKVIIKSYDHISMYAPLVSTSFIKRLGIERITFKRMSFGIAFRTC